jgi:hypothetical protein
MQISEKYVIVIEVLGMALLISALIYAIGLIATAAIIGSSAIIIAAQIVKTR